jgi:histidinol dehydrogenase
MLTTVIYPSQAEWETLLERPATEAAVLWEQVSKIMLEVKSKGDSALRAYTKEFDGVELRELVLDEAAMKRAVSEISVDLHKAIRQAAANIRAFHAPQLKEGEAIETMPGITCWRRSRPIEKVGLYIPGGTAPLFSTILMLGIPAQLAGCREVVLCTPP